MLETESISIENVKNSKNVLSSLQNQLDTLINEIEKLIDSDKKITKDNQISYSMYKNALVLPSHYNLTNDEIKKISKNIIKFVSKDSKIY